MVKQGIIEMSAALGFAWQKSHPEISELYRKGIAPQEIVKLLSLNGSMDIPFSMRTLTRGVLYHISGYKGSENILPYEGSIDFSERKALAKSNRMRDHRTSYGKQRSARAGIIALGKTPWLRKQDLKENDLRPGELESLLSLIEDPEMKHDERHLFGSPRYNKLAERLHKIYPEVPKRSSHSIRCALYKNKDYSPGRLLASS